MFVLYSGPWGAGLAKIAGGTEIHKPTLDARVRTFLQGHAALLAAVQRGEHPAVVVFSDVRALPDPRLDEVHGAWPRCSAACGRCSGRRDDRLVAGFRTGAGLRGRGRSRHKRNYRTHEQRH
jgi:hypothetical protein